MVVNLSGGVFQRGKNPGLKKGSFFFQKKAPCGVIQRSLIGVICDPIKPES